MSRADHIESLVAKANAKHQEKINRMLARLEAEKAKNAVIDPKEAPVAKLIQQINDAVTKNSYYPFKLIETLAKGVIGERAKLSLTRQKREKKTTTKKK